MDHRLGQPAAVTAAGARPRRRWLRPALEYSIVAAFAGFLGWALVSQWSQVRTVLTDLSPMAVAAAAGAGLAGIWASFLVWRSVLAALGHRPPVTGGMRIFFVGQAGKYVPGAVWPVLAQIRLGRRYQLPDRVSATAAIIFMLVVLGTGLLVAVATVPLFAPGAYADYWWLLPALPAVAVLLWPPLLNRLLPWLLHRLRQQPLPAPLSPAGMIRAAGWALVMWTGYGLHLWLLLASLAGPTGATLPLRALGAFAAAWCVGFLLVVAPAGAGPREVALVVLLAGAVEAPAALVAALVSRLLLTAGDLAWPAVALAVTSRTGAGTTAEDSPRIHQGDV
ncbi:flippase-like domain-containing protein [Natronosporangium hydrolyticum]|uniref:Flippase-like domain-containing protein n=1 Tax=Natronosporangium hydrolyticum TaxID=2811111 RepID=A0A895Y917_9ACTN|nr:lysylphosphatidylglycerol synthase domain-containing protein [Natronosporangium hydrolyticum]QSB14244.1 flippase-like domain-containing protein [Natronosporangium hydrolyticum]